MSSENKFSEWLPQRQAANKWWQVVVYLRNCCTFIMECGPERQKNPMKARALPIAVELVRSFVEEDHPALTARLKELGHPEYSDSRA